LSFSRRTNVTEQHEYKIDEAYYENGEHRYIVRHNGIEIGRTLDPEKARLWASETAGWWTGKSECCLKAGITSWASLPNKR
jgi:hypothetical protein